MRFKANSSVVYWCKDTLQHCFWFYISVILQNKNLKSISSYRTDVTNCSICEIVHHACRTQADCSLIISSLKLFSKQSAYPGFVTELITYIKKNLRVVEFNLVHCCIDRSGIVHHARR